VDRTRVAEPTDLTPLAQDGGAMLTLITCYPFHWVGPAPKRFIVQAIPG
jgi:sortase A